MELHEQIMVSSDNRTGDAFELTKPHPRIWLLLNSEFKKKLAASMAMPRIRAINYKGLTRTYTVMNDPNRWSVKVVL